MKRARRAISVVEMAIVASASAVIVVCTVVLGVLVFDEGRGEQWTSGLRPVQFFQEFEAELLDDYTNVFGVAHNSGDTIPTTFEAITYGADVIEVDVVSLNGRLYAAHDVPATWFGDSLFRGPPLEQIWIASAAADVIKLDLKESSPAFTELVLDFLLDRRGQRTVIVVSNDATLLGRFAEKAPTVLRFYSIGSARAYERMQDDSGLTATLDGVSIRHSLLDDGRASWLEDQELITLAWTVNDLERVNELVLLGVDAITTDNLAIVKLLGGQQRGERRLERRRAFEPAPGLTPSPLTAAVGR